MKAETDEEFTAYVAASAVRLRRMAYLLCGDWQRADDELQSALVKLYLAWHRVRARDSLDAFVRKILVRGLVDTHRRPWRREQAQAVQPTKMGSKGMSDIKASLHAAVTEGEPPLGFAAPDIIAAAHRARRRKRGVYAAVTAGAAAAVAAVTVVALPGGSAPSAGAPSAGGHAGQAGSLSLTALTKTAMAKTTRHVKGTAVSLTGPVVEGVTAARVVALAEKTAHVGLTAAQASVLAPAGELNLAAAIAVPGQPYLNIQVIPAHNLLTARPTCAELSDAAAGTGDGYYGPCSIKRLADGSLLIARSGTTKAGGLTMAQASIIRPDGSGVFAEDTNQAQPTVKQIVKLKEQGKVPPPARATPPIGSAALTILVQSIATQR